MTRREAIKVTLMFSGLVVLVCGLAVLWSSPPLTGHDSGAMGGGAWKALRVAGAAPKAVAPYMIIGGASALVVGWFLREP